MPVHGLQLILLDVVPFRRYISVNKMLFLLHLVSFESKFSGEYNGYTDGVLGVSYRTPADPVKKFAWMCLYMHMWCAWVCCLWRVLGWIKRPLKCVLAGHDRSVGNNPQSAPRGPPWMTPHLDWMQPPNPVCHLTHPSPSPPDGEMNQRERASHCPRSLRKYSSGEWRDDLIRSSRWDQMVRWQVRESGGGKSIKKRGREKERD